MSNNTIEKVTEIELAAFVAALSAFINIRDRREYPNCPANWRIIVSEPGKRYARLVEQDEVPRIDQFNGGLRRSAFCFIDLTNGDILKAASWSAPAKHARGNIRVGSAADGWGHAIGCYGAARR